VNSGGAVARLRAILRKLAGAPAELASVLPDAAAPPRIGLALGGGFARGMAHVGVLRVFEREKIPIHCVAGVSAGALVAAALASGTPVDEIGRIGCAMRFTDVARWSISRMGLVASERMASFVKRLLRKYTFEEMEIPLGILATDLGTGQSVPFRDKGDVILPIRASCSYPGLFQPIRYQDMILVDGAMSMEVPALLARKMGATHVVSVALPMQGPVVSPQNMLQVVNRCFQILQSRNEESWRKQSDVVITPDVRGVKWDGFENGTDMIAAGERAAEAALPHIQEWLKQLPARESSLKQVPAQQLAS
jgi:NTE family protein